MAVNYRGNTSDREVAKIKFLEKQIRPGDVFADIGACEGFFTFLAADLVKNYGTVLAFEPNHANSLRLLDKYIDSEYANIHLFDYAVSDFNGIADLYIGESFGLHTLKPNLDGRTEMTEIVHVVTLDNFCWQMSIDGIKIDVEGNDIEVLEGAEKTLQSVRYLAMDVHPTLGVDVKEVERLIVESGMTIVTRPEQRREIFAIREA